jgi:hypothetical protein
MTLLRRKVIFALPVMLSAGQSLPSGTAALVDLAALWEFQTRRTTVETEEQECGDDTRFASMKPETGALKEE